MSAYVSECTLVHIDTPTVGRRNKQVTHEENVGKNHIKPSLKKLHNEQT